MLNRDDLDKLPLEMRMKMLEIIEAKKLEQKALPAPVIIEETAKPTVGEMEVAIAQAVLDNERKTEDGNMAVE